MPNAVVKSYAKKTGKSAEHIEGWWKEAEEQAKKKFKKKSPRYWAYVNGIVKRRAGLSESISFREFMDLMSEEAEQGDTNGTTIRPTSDEANT